MAKIKQKTAPAVHLQLKPIDLATAENWLMRDELVRIFKPAIGKDLGSSLLSYSNGFTGEPKTLLNLASLFNEYFHPHVPVQPSHIITGAGAGALLESLLFNICNPGDGILVIAPYWNGFDFCFTVKPGIRAIPVHTTAIEGCFSKAVVSCLRETFKQESNTSRIRGLILCNPHNPLGRCFPRSVVAECMRFCQENDLHFISDEIYALSTFEAEDLPNATPFESGLSLDLDVVGCDSDRVHVLWSMSKDFGCSGLRIGCLVNQSNTDLRTAVALTACNQISSLTTIAVNSILSMPPADLNKFIALNRLALGHAYSKITTLFQQHGITYFPCNAGVYIWARLGGDKVQTQEQEMAIWTRLNQHGVGVSAGTDYHSAEAGWFRISFAVPEDVLMEALQRMQIALGLDPNPSYLTTTTDKQDNKKTPSLGDQKLGAMDVVRWIGRTAWNSSCRIAGYY